MTRAARGPGYNILVRLRPVDKTEQIVKSKGGIITEIKKESDFELEQKEMCEAHVVSIGETAFHMSSTGATTPWCKIGDCILLNRYAGTLVDLKDGFTYRSIQCIDIKCIFPEDELKGEELAQWAK